MVADVAPFPLALAEATGLGALALNELNTEPSAPAFLWVLLLMALPCVLCQWPG